MLRAYLIFKFIAVTLMICTNYFFRLILISMLLLTCAVAEAGLGEGVDAYQSGNYRAAIKEFMPLAAKGDAIAQFNLGMINELGQGVRQNYPKAVSRYRQAAEQGYMKAQLKLGEMYSKGQGVLQDYKESASWFRQAAEQGDALAQFNLGVMYAQGHGVAQNDEESARWFGKAAEQGNQQAQMSLGVMYATGQGVKQDYAAAINWYSKAAEQGNAPAQYNLGLLYAKGDGFNQDLVQAYKWFSLAGMVAGEQSMIHLSQVESKMTPQEIETAQTLTREWRGKYAEMSKPEVLAAEQAKLEQVRIAGKATRNPPIIAASTPNADTVSPASTAKIASAVTATPSKPATTPPKPTGAHKPTDTYNSDDVLKMVHEWAAEWSDKNVKGYLAFYAEDFKIPGNTSRTDWEALRIDRINKPEFIKVEISDAKVKFIDDSHASVSFKQSYRASHLKDISNKTLLLMKSGDNWLIQEELSGS